MFAMAPSLSPQDLEDQLRLAKDCIWVLRGSQIDFQKTFFLILLLK